VVWGRHEGRGRRARGWREFPGADTRPGIRGGTVARVLVIDDDDAIRIALRHVLEKAGHQVVDAPDGESALGLCRDHAVDLVITDIFLPSKDGVEVVIELRREFPGARVIAISSFDDISLLQAGAFGAIRIFRKPLDMDRLVGEIEEILSADA
jgi:DNA-binding NtrC family response regulator